MLKLNSSSCTLRTASPPNLVGVRGWSRIVMYHFLSTYLEGYLPFPGERIIVCDASETQPRLLLSVLSSTFSQYLYARFSYIESSMYWKSSPRFCARHGAL